MNRNRILLIFLAVLCIIVFVFALVGHGALDSSVSKDIQSIQEKTWLSVFNGIAYLGDVIVIAVLSVLILFYFYRKKSLNGAVHYIFVLIGIGINFVVKELVQRARPINPFETDFSFPSNHVVGSVLVYGFICYLLYKNKKKYFWVPMIIPILVAFSRLYLNVHWLTDVVGGAAFAIFWLCVSFFFFHKSK